MPLLQLQLQLQLQAILKQGDLVVGSMVPHLLLLCLAAALPLFAIVEGFQSFSPVAGAGHLRRDNGASRPSSMPPVSRPSTASSSVVGAMATFSNDGDAELTMSEVRTLFALLADSTVLYDPSRGTCCRNQCSGCAYLDPSDGSFRYDEHVSEGEDGGWLAPYATVDFGTRIHNSKWSQTLLPPGDAGKGKEVERDGLASLLGEPDVSPLALRCLWDVLSPAAGYPRLTSGEIARAIRGMEGSAYDMGGAADFSAFERSMRGAADRIALLGGDDGGDAAPDYDSMTKEELLELVDERGMKRTFPKMKRIIIEELRFFDTHGRQGKRHPVKNTLS